MLTYTHNIINFQAPVQYPPVPVKNLLDALRRLGYTKGGTYMFLYIEVLK
jgi:hypothetical protein